MINLSKFVNSENGRILMSIILGFGLSALFKFTCKGKNCIIYNAAPSEEIKDKIFTFNQKCYKFEETSAECDNNKQILEFA